MADRQFKPHKLPGKRGRTQTVGVSSWCRRGEHSHCANLACTCKNQKCLCALARSCDMPMLGKETT